MMRSGLLRRLREFSMGLRGLVSFLTIIPAGGKFEYAPRYFYLAPLIGLIEGLLSSLPLLISKPVGAALSTALTYLINGFQHMDGFLDFGETLLTGRRGEDAVRILKDPHRGAFALTLGLINVLLVYSSLLSMGKEALVTLPITETAAAYVMYTTAYLGKPSEGGLGRLFIVEAKGKAELTSSTLLYAIITIILPLLYHWGALAISITITASVLVSLLVALLTVKLSHSRLGFVNGDVLGFSFELSKVTLLTIYSSLGYLLTVH
ncbi:adenosylcobinamide-GDP ribazoletransferase [Caldivirga sp. UBA161]|uniref:adenosylcobinamide-GDP ribazoletransferase n=1 Tax=Caldivirga sp. UBA161 TaxID=1915569 RepID=UPI0025C10499|nr:adenosylcobinamide-GDP ribazoletransferase [Caldivirga sp. UBA161]